LPRLKRNPYLQQEQASKPKKRLGREKDLALGSKREFLSGEKKKV